MKKPINYTNEPMDARVINDFLPPSGKLRLKRSADLLEPEIRSKYGKKQFVLLPYEQYQSLRRRLEAAERLRDAARSAGTEANRSR